MSKHDTWVELIDGHPFESIQDLLPQGFPMRDPFPLGFAERNDQTFALFVMDMERLDDEQKNAIAVVMAQKYGVTKETILDDAKINGFCVDHKWVKSMTGEAENYQRNIEFLDYFELHPEPSREAFESFVRQQIEDWVEGNKIPDPLPENYEDVDERIKSQELEDAYKQRAISKFIDQGNYSVLDFLTGRAIVDALNHIDPDAGYELSGADALYED